MALPIGLHTRAMAWLPPPRQKGVGGEEGYMGPYAHNFLDFR
jgi:hypothetical protein